MSDKCKHIQALLPAYMAERLETFDVLDVESHIEACEYCRDELINLGEVFEQVRGCFQAGSAQERLDQSRLDALHARRRETVATRSVQTAEILPFPEIPGRGTLRPLTRRTVARTLGLAAALLFVVSPFLLLGVPQPTAEPGASGTAVATEAPERGRADTSTPASGSFAQQRPTAEPTDRFGRESGGSAMMLTYLSDYTYDLGAEPVVISEEPYFGLAGPPAGYFSTTAL